MSLPPPIIKNIIPAFYQTGNKIKISIPFDNNKGVNNKGSDGKYQLKVKTPQSSQYLFDAGNAGGISCTVSPDKNKVDFIFASTELKDILHIGQYYKLQLAYVDDKNNVGDYSSVASAKYTNYPTLSILKNGESENLSSTGINKHQFSYTGKHVQEEDLSEKVYSYCFNLYDSNYKIIDTSGDIIHNSENDTLLTESVDTYVFSQDLNPTKMYYVDYSVTTINGLIATSPKYKIMQKLSIDPEIKAEIIARPNVEEGYVDIHLIPKAGYKTEQLVITGKFKLSRTSEDTDFTVWEEIDDLIMHSQFPSLKLYRDFTVEHGKKYKYAIQQYNDANLFSNRLKSNEVFVNFEHAFLLDKDRQLKIKFNPKITNLKTNIPETKIDTIGGKYPFIFRNGQVNYKEFPISGLISYYMDDEKLFLSEEEFSIGNPILDKTTNFTGENIFNERNFKLKVLEWLTDGNPKIFRSPTEGNFIVRLINCSLTPMDQLGRMLHTFNCTAYEIAEFNYENLKKYGFINLEKQAEPILQFSTIDLFNKTGILNQITMNNKPTTPVIYHINLQTSPGAQFIFTFENGDKEIITIGATGAYTLNIPTGIKTIEPYPSSTPYPYQGTLHFGYYYEVAGTFKKIQDATTEEVNARQFIGENDIIQQIEYIKIAPETWIKNPKIELIQISSFKGYARNIISAKALIPQIQTIEEITNPNIFSLYELNGIHWEYKDGEWIEHKTLEEGKLTFEQESFNMPFEINHSIKPSIFTINYPCMAEISYQYQDIEYIVESDEEKYPQLYSYKNLYNEKKNALNDLMASQPNTDENFDDWYASYIVQEKELRTDIDNFYSLYIEALVAALAQEEEEGE